MSIHFCDSVIHTYVSHVYSNSINSDQSTHRSSLTRVKAVCQIEALILEPLFQNVKAIISILMFLMYIATVLTQISRLIGAA